MIWNKICRKTTSKYNIPVVTRYYNIWFFLFIPVYINNYKTEFHR